MPTLVIRNLSPELHQKLKAAKQFRSEESY
jgi:plasmid stability protein